MRLFIVHLTLLTLSVSTQPLLGQYTEDLPNGPLTSNSVGVWAVMPGGSGHRHFLNRSDIPIRNLRVADFDGDDTADIIASWNGYWHIRYRGSGEWQDFNNSGFPVSDLGLGDFDGDGKTDVLEYWNGLWHIRWAGLGSWQDFNNSTIPMSDLGFGDFDHDGKTDILAQWGGLWHIRYSGQGSWQDFNNSTIPMSDLGFGDFDHDGNTDIMAQWGGKWHIRYAGQGSWRDFNTSDLGIADLRFGDFDDDGKTDVFASWGNVWHVRYGGIGAWENLRTYGLSVRDLAFGDFDGDKRTDVVAAETQTNHFFRIRVHTSVSLTEARADSILEDASNILRKVDGSPDDDVACFATLSRYGALESFTHGDGTIYNANDLHAINAIPGNVKVVDEIKYCDKLKPGIVGCATTPWETFTVTRQVFSEEGAIWTHELGHNMGLNHDSTSVTRVMYPSTGANNRTVTWDECDKYRDLRIYMNKGGYYQKAP